MTRLENQKKTEMAILDGAFEVFVSKSIEAATFDDVAKKSGVGVATVYRYYKNKQTLATAVAVHEWEKFYDGFIDDRPIEYVTGIMARDRLEYTLDMLIDMYVNNKLLLIYNGNYNHFIQGYEIEEESLNEYIGMSNVVNDRFHLMYEKAKDDKSIRTDMSEDELFRITCHTMIAACQYYAGGFIWGASANRDYTKDLLVLKQMMMDYVTKDIAL